jgi:hypothetical protein
MTSRFVSGDIQRWTEWLVDLLGPGSFGVMLVIPVFALAFLLASVVQRQPQIQFVAEFLIGAGFVFFAFVMYTD